MTSFSSFTVGVHCNDINEDTHILTMQMHHDVYSIQQTLETIATYCRYRFHYRHGVTFSNSNICFHHTTNVHKLCNNSTHCFMNPFHSYYSLQTKKGNTKTHKYSMQNIEINAKKQHKTTPLKERGMESTSLGEVGK